MNSRELGRGLMVGLNPKPRGVEKDSRVQGLIPL